MVVGCPAAGKSWVCDQLASDFHYVHHDLFKGMHGAAYVAEIIKQSATAQKPLLIEAPFSMREIKDPLIAAGFRVTTVFIQENDSVLRQRYRAREGREIPPGHLTRQKTYLERARLLRAFVGSSAQVLEHLRNQAKNF